jgi:hypothetical protein
MGKFAARQNRASSPRPAAPARPTILTTTGAGGGERSVVDLERSSETQVAQQMLQAPADALGAGRNSVTHPAFRLDFSRINIHRPSARAPETMAEISQRKGTTTPSKVRQSLLNRLIRSGLPGGRGCEVTLDGRLWGADLSSVSSFAESLES